MTIGAKEDGALELRLFGTFDVRIAGRPMPPLRYRKEQWILALLALRHDRDVARDWLAATFWPDNEESQGLFYLRKALSNLRGALGLEAHRLQSSTTRTVRLDLSGAFADVLVFDTAVRRPRTEPGQEERLLEALSLYQGPLLQDCLDEWVTVERESRAQSYLSALEVVADHARIRGDAAAASRWLRLALTAEPYRESAAAALMQTLAESGDRAALRQVYQELRQRLRDDLNTTPAPETESLYEQLAERLAQAPAKPAPPAPAASPEAARRHLPVPLTDLIGRETEIAEVKAVLERARLMTLLGPGGVGKTRLAIAAAEAVLPRFSEGVWFVDLAPLIEEGYVPDAVARALEMPGEAGLSAEEHLTKQLRVRSLLLVLDNCEHLREACAGLAQRLLTVCPGLRLLATSRQPLGLIGEQVYPVPSLALPSWDDIESPSGLLNTEKNPSFLLEYAGIALFVQRAVQANPAFRLDRRNAQAVCRICLRLDGIPLAIELAAARVRSLSVGDIQTRLADRFRLLAGGNRSALPRQQTLRALVDWSYSLLSPPEQALLGRLSVFAGSWTLEAAERVCADDAVAEEGILDALTALVEKSLVVHESQRGESRYHLLETIREYAGERLAAAEEEDIFRRQHCDYFAALVAEAEPNLRGAESGLWLDRLETEHDNLRQMLAFCERGGEEARTGLRLLSKLTIFWLNREHLKEGRQRCATFLARQENSEPTPERASVLILAGNLAYCQGDNPAALQHFEASLTVRKQLGDRRGVASALGSLGNVAHVQGDYVRARALFEEALVLCREFGALTWEAVTLGCLGNVTFDQGDYVAARAYTGAALNLCRQRGERETESITLCGLGRIALKLDAPADAIHYYEQALAVDREIGKASRESVTLCNLGVANAALGNTAAAGAFYYQSLTLRSEGGDIRTAAPILGHVAAFLAERGERYTRAACRVLGAVERLREEIGVPHSPSEQEIRDRAMSAIRLSLPEGAIATAQAEGRAMPLVKAVAYAMEEVSALSPSGAARNRADS